MCGRRQNNLDSCLVILFSGGNYETWNDQSAFSACASSVSNSACHSLNSLGCCHVRDQGQIFDTDGIVVLGSDSFSQSITAGITGKLSAVLIQCDGRASEGCSADVTYSIYSGGNPVTGSPIYTEVVTTDIETDAIFQWLLHEIPGLFFYAGDQFTFAFQADTPGNIFAGNDPPGYRGGELFKNGVQAGRSRDDFGNLTGESQDVGFITLVTPIPVPTSLLLLGSALGILTLTPTVRRRQRKDY